MNLASILFQVTVYKGALMSAGFVFGMKHALDADHLAAVSTIVSEKRSWLSSSLVGGLWGIGHTISLFAAGIVVLLLKIPIGPRLESALEMCVGVMLIGLGANAVIKVLRGGQLHLHQHRHGGKTHLHPHTHEPGQAHDGAEASHHSAVSRRPLWIGMVHGLAGSAALMLLVLSTIQSPAIGLLYITVFGVGSVGGMMLMSLLLSLPFHLTSNRFHRANLTARILAGAFSIGFGFLIIWEKGGELMS